MGPAREAAPAGGVIGRLAALGRRLRPARVSAWPADRDDPPATAIIPDPQGARPGTLRFRATGPHQKGPNAIEVLVPDGMDPARRYPVVYLLPVNTGTDGPWGSGVAEAMRCGLHNRHRAIFVGPAFDTVPWYGDNPDRPEVCQATHLTRAVIPFIDREFPTLPGPEGRFVAGFSKSGLGALSLFLQHPELFGSVAAFDPAFAPTPANFNRWGVADSYGSRSNFERADPMVLLGRHRGRLRGGRRRIVLLCGGPGVRVGAERYRARLAELGIPFLYMLGSNMPHTWTSGWLSLAISGLAPGEPAAGA